MKDLKCFIGQIKSSLSKNKAEESKKTEEPSKLAELVPSIIGEVKEAVKTDYSAFEDRFFANNAPVVKIDPLKVKDNYAPVEVIEGLVKDEVSHKLRLFKQPIRLFGEDEQQRKKRLALLESSGIEVKPQIEPKNLANPNQ